MLTFLLQLTVGWGVFALLYSTLLRRETFFSVNRLYLIATALLGLLLPLVAGWLPSPAGVAGMPVVVLPVFTTTTSAADGQAGRTLSEVLWWAYFAGLAFSGARLLLGLWRIVRMAVMGRAERLPDGCVMIRTTESAWPFSFFKWIFVPADFEDESPDTAAVLAHERAHAHAWHSADVLLMECLCVAFWFHPLAHWYRRSLRAVHEFSADTAAASQTNRKQYGLLLIRQSQSGMSLALAHHFFQSPLKQRLIMLTKKSSAPLRACRYGLLLPLLLLLTFIFQKTPALAQQNADPQHVQQMRDLEARGWVNTDTVVTFDPETYKETVELVQNNVGPKTGPDGQLVYQVCDKLPEFPGGTQALMNFLAQNLQYPPQAKAEKAQQMVVLEFVVQEDGSLSDMQAKKGGTYRPDLLEESLRVLRLMPKWTPAEHKGKKVKCSMMLPIRFRLE